MIDALHSQPQILQLLIISICIIAIIFYIGIFCGRLWLDSANAREFGSSQLLFGFIITSFFSSLSTVGINSVITITFVGCILLLFITREKNKLTISRPRRSTERLIVLVLGFIILFALRIFSLYNTNTGQWNLMLKDDIHYIEVINYISYFKIENVPYELGKYAFKIKDIHYQPYHYISFSIALLIKEIFNFSSFELFHFFICPLFETFAFYSLYEVGRERNKNIIFSFILSLSLLSMLRYYLFDEWLNTPMLAKNKILVNFFGLQFLNSGFGFKMSFTVLILCAAFEQLKRNKTHLISFFSLINPIYIIFVSWFTLFLFRYDRKKALQTIIWTAVIVLTSLLFFKLNSSVNSPIDKTSLMSGIRSLKGITTLIIISYSNFILNFYTILLLPSLIIIIYRKNLIEKSLGVTFCLAPIYHDWFSNNIFTLVYFSFIVISLLFLLFRNNYSQISILLLSTIFIFLVGSEVALIITDLNQIFLFVLYSSVLYAGVYIITYTKYDQKIWLSLLFILLIHNVYANFLENTFRSIPLSSEKTYMIKLKHLLVRYKPKRAGYYDSEISHPFMNQYFIGEEILLLNDTIFATPLKLPKLSEPKSTSQQYFVTKLPLYRYLSEQKNNSDTILNTLKFIRNNEINIIAVKNRDRSHMKRILCEYSDSIQNPIQDYTIYLRKNND